MRDIHHLSFETTFMEISKNLNLLLIKIKIIHKIKVKIVIYIIFAILLIFLKFYIIINDLLIIKL